MAQRQYEVWTWTCKYFAQWEAYSTRSNVKGWCRTCLFLQQAKWWQGVHNISYASHNVISLGSQRQTLQIFARGSWMQLDPFMTKWHKPATYKRCKQKCNASESLKTTAQKSTFPEAMKNQSKKHPNNHLYQSHILWHPLVPQQK